MIEVTNISKKFFLLKPLKETLFSPFKPKKEILAVDQVSLDVDKAKILALLGPNGAGKTTLIKMLCTLLLPDGGSAKISGYDLLSQPHFVKRKISLVSSEDSFYPRLSGRQNLEFFGVIYDMSPTAIKEKIDKYSSIFDIGTLDKPFWNYSTGTKRRLSLLRTLMLEREIIFMDEPTKSLDPLCTHQLRNFIIKMAREFGKTIFFATHSLEEAETVADRVVILDKGKVLLAEEIQTLRRQYREEKSPLTSLYIKLIKKIHEEIS